MQYRSVSGDMGKAINEQGFAYSGTVSTSGILTGLQGPSCVNVSVTPIRATEAQSFPPRERFLVGWAWQDDKVWDKQSPGPNCQENHFISVKELCLVCVLLSSLYSEQLRTQQAHQSYFQEV